MALVKIRTIMFYFFWTLVSIFWTCLIVISCVLPFRWRHRLATQWSDITLFLLRIICGVRYEVQGEAHIPHQAVVIVMNHQSTWETIFAPQLQRQQTWVMKRELLWIPFFGWAMALLRPIAINRAHKREAMRQIIAQGEKHIQQGFSIVMFPEGHRFPVDAPIHFKLGAVKLASALELSILPIAHNAGKCWSRGGWIHAGMIRVQIGKSVQLAQDSDVSEINQMLQQWVSATRDSL